MGDKHATEKLQASPSGIARAAELLRDEQLVALPTETVYGLAARADSDRAIAKVYRAKGRPDFNPLIVHVSGVGQAEDLAEFSAAAHQAARQFWPGPLTLVLPIKSRAGVAKAVTAGLQTIALRCPSDPQMRAVLEACDFPLAAPSANRSGAVSPTNVQHVVSSLGGRIAAVIDGGECTNGVESTIITLRETGVWQLLRPGPIPVDRLEAVLGASQSAASSGVEAPGQLAQHYSPGKPVRLNATGALPGEYFIGFGPMDCDCNLSQAGDLAEAAMQLYACLHLAAAAPNGSIAVAPIAETGLGLAINDRLRRAAA